MGMLLTAAVALLVLVYTYVGYPALVYLAARIRPRRVCVDTTYTPSVSALIPVYNSSAALTRKLDSLFALDYPRDNLEVLVCSDGSTDDTDATLAEYAAREPRVRVFRSAERKGKPHALNLLREHARGDVLLMTDVRQPLSADALRRLVSHLADPSVGCASGELVLRGETGAGLYWKYERWIRQNESLFRSTVGVTGAIYVLRTADLRPLPENLILDDMWIPMRLRCLGQRIVFVPGAFAYDEAFADGRELGRKIRTLAGNYQLFARMPRLLLPLANPSWFETISHKIMRLVCPWALVVLFLTTSWLLWFDAPGAGPTVAWFVRLLWAGQLLFYTAAAAGRSAGRIAGVARTFVVLNYAAVAGLWRFVKGRQKVAW